MPGLRGKRTAMTNPKSTNAPHKAPRGPARRAGANRPQPASPAGNAHPAGGAGNLDETIAKAQQGRVNVTPAKAVEMAGQLYRRGNYGQAERVCRQIIEARPGNADAHNILGVTLAALGRSKEAVAELQRAIKINPQAASYHANLGEV